MNGTVLFSDVKTGYYSIVAELDGYDTVQTGAEVDVNGTTDHTITLDSRVK